LVNRTIFQKGRALDDFVTKIQMFYPRIYMACHVDHVKTKTSDSSVSVRDSTILAHLSSEEYRYPKELALHLRITPSTLSEALHNLVSQGYVRFISDEDDGRRTLFSLTDKGSATLKESSVLDSKRVEAVLSVLSDEEKNQAVKGLEILANAGRRLAQDAR
jgi:DNA-binding MarR family transcriptional regulator